MYIYDCDFVIVYGGIKRRYYYVVIKTNDKTNKVSHRGSKGTYLLLLFVFVLVYAGNQVYFNTSSVLY